MSHEITLVDNASTDATVACVQSTFPGTRVIVAPRNLGFAVAVAAFGQKLAADAHIGDFTYDDILNLAKATRGEDEFGYRTEFMQLVRTAKSAAGEKGGFDKRIILKGKK